MIKLLLALLISLIFSFGGNLQQTKPAFAEEINQITFGCKSAYMIDADSGECIYKLNESERLPIASVCKVMTLNLCFDAINSGKLTLDDDVTVSANAAGMGGSQVFLKENCTYTLSQLIKSIIVCSANDSSVAVAETVCGSESKFVENMNKKAVEIGAENTNFCNPSGLPNENHFTTARDLCNIARYAMQNQVFKKIVSSKNYNGKYRSYSNKNKMLFSCEGANGVKTGYTLKAGRCLVSSAEREGMDVVCVVLNCPQMYEISSEILNNCFNKFALKTLSNDRVFLCKNKPCCVKESKVFVVNKDIELRYEVLCHAQFGCNKDNLVGDLNVYEENRLLFSENLYSI